MGSIINKKAGIQEKTGAEHEDGLVLYYHPHSFYSLKVISERNWSFFFCKYVKLPYNLPRKLKLYILHNTGATFFLESIYFMLKKYCEKRNGPI